ncbi:MAG: hypothetical protein IBX39_03525 [Candidatus Methanoperedenaceae archaeon]|nr:hypothetical protein [Candidatus Methanoperedenaceae archaeon]MDW7727203.1 hypothetical protein [Candidatus Methanoperedens sp.]
MIDINTLPIVPKFILILGFMIGFMSFLLMFRYTIMLVLMKISPEYRKFVRDMLEKKKQIR